MDYVVAYAKQETLDPVVRQAKALGRGVVGALLVSVGTVLLAVGLLRALQGQFGSSASPTAATAAGLGAGGAPRGLGTSRPVPAPGSAGSALGRGASTPGAPTTVALAAQPSAAEPGPTTLVASTANPYGSGQPLSGDWSWVPYMGGALLCLLVTAFCLVRLVRGTGR